MELFETLFEDGELVELKCLRFATKVIQTVEAHMPEIFCFSVGDRLNQLFLSFLIDDDLVEFLEMMLH